MKTKDTTIKVVDYEYEANIRTGERLKSMPIS